MKCYFAHPAGFYGTCIEAAIIAGLQAAGYEVVNPALAEHAAAAKQMARPMAYFEDLVASCDAICFLRFDDGAIGAGVAGEIDTARAAGLEILEFTDGAIRPIRGDVAGLRLDIEATRERNRSMKGA